MSEKDNFEKRDNDEFNLYTEDIVVKRSVKYRKVICLGKLIVEAAVFGGVACFAFVTLYPWMSTQFIQEDKRSEISIPRDDYPEEETESTTEVTQKTDAVYAENDNSLKAFSKMMVEVKKCIVTVSAIYNDKDDLLNNSTGDTSGLIFAETDNRYIILTNYDVVKNASSINVLFNNGNTISANLLKGDLDTGIATIYVSLNDQTDTEMSNVSIANFGNSYSVEQGDFVIAAGKVLGNSASVDFGTTVNVKTSQSGIDSNYSIISTNIQQYSGDYAFLFNANGNVIGIIKKDNTDNNKGIMNIYGISDLKALVEKLSNNKGITYLGITGMNVTGSIASMNSLPIGIYITQVQDNSPAFAAGIQTGDVITMVNGDSVLTFKALSDKLYNCKSGDAVIITVKRRQGSSEYKNMDFSVTLGER